MFGKEEALVARIDCRAARNKAARARVRTHTANAAIKSKTAINSLKYNLNTLKFRSSLFKGLQGQGTESLENPRRPQTAKH